MDYLPAFLNVRDQWTLVIGGGEIATRKTDILLRAGARVRVIAPEIGAALADQVQEHGGEALFQSYSADAIDGVKLVVSATDDRALNARVSVDAQAAGVLVNVVDQPDLCTFVFPAIVDRAPVIAAVTSGGAAPVLARMLRAKLEAIVPAGYGKLAALAAGYRDRVKATLPTVEARRKFWEDMFEGRVAELVYQGDEDAARALLESSIGERDTTQTIGEIYLVGAGPGDPDLLTFKALRLMQRADVVLYDRLVNPEILDRVRRDAERVHVGKQRDDHPVPQEEINAMLVRLAKEGKRVLRLKGGDPFIFGRGGEEIEQALEHGIPVQVVPGITAANGCAAYAGIPLTHRDHAQSVRFLTGHRQKNGELDLPWKNIVEGADRETLVFYMGLVSLPELSRQLIEHGMDAEMPVAVVEKGTLPEQRVVAAPLGGIAAKAELLKVGGPALVVVGRVVGEQRQS